MKTKKLSGIIALALTIGLCQTAVPADAAALALSTKKLNLKVSQTVTLKVKKTNKKAKWSVLSGKKNVRLSAKKKASVKVKALKAGKAKISCKLGKKKLICNVVVKGSSKSEKNAEQKSNTDDAAYAKSGSNSGGDTECNAKPDAEGNRGTVENP